MISNIFGKSFKYQRYFWVDMEKKHKVIMYRTSTCRYCHMAEEFFKEHKIKYKSVDVGKDRQAAMEMVEKSGQMGVPVIEIDHKVIIVGYDVSALKKHLKISK